MHCVSCVIPDITSSSPAEDDAAADDDAIKDNRLSSGVQDDEQDLPVYLWRPGHTTEVMGAWEQHTRVSNFTAR